MSSEKNKILNKNHYKMTKKSEASADAKKQQNAKNQEDVNKPHFQVQFDITYGGTYITKSGESLTVPDMNLTVRQLLTNHSRGLSNDRHLKTPIYFDYKIPKIKDMVDVQEYREYLNTHIASVEKFIKDNKKLEEEKKAAAEKAKYKQMSIDEEIEKDSKNDVKP